MISSRIKTEMKDVSGKTNIYCGSTTTKMMEFNTCSDMMVGLPPQMSAMRKMIKDTESKVCMMIARNKTEWSVRHSLRILLLKLLATRWYYLNILINVKTIVISMIKERSPRGRIH